jgi:uncharacterized C2H2 Zn-finger protein
MIKCAECVMEFITEIRLEKHFNKAHRNRPDYSTSPSDAPDDGGE